jgi:hypothetical protein
MFNKHVIRHRFCPMCGMHPYGEAKDPKGQPTAAINVPCIEEIDLTKIPSHISTDARANTRPFAS